MKQRIAYEHLGNIPYAEAWAYQEHLLETRVQAKRNGTTIDSHHLLFCYHPPVITLSKRTNPDHLLISETELKKKGIECHPTNRGGDITYHGPGQLVLYPILDLEQFHKDIHTYLRLLEQVVIDTLSEHKIEGTRTEGLTGVWIERAKTRAKIAAIGIRCSHWISMHGIAFNLKTDLSHFDYIIPCGIKNKEVTSLDELIPGEVNLQEIEDQILRHFIKHFDLIAFSYYPRHSSKIQYDQQSKK